ncbi:MAG: hypothetical protein WDA03_11985 [Trueperaceae bacterium]
MKRLPLLLIAALTLLLAACSQPTASPELEGEWAGNVGVLPVSFEVQPGGYVYANSFRIEHDGETLTVDVSSQADGTSIVISVVAVHSNGDSMTFTLNGEVNGNTLSGDYQLTVVVNGESSTASGTFSLNRVTGT